MSRITQRSRFFKLALPLFLSGQAFSVAHAREFGEVPHEHNGVQCAAMISNDEQEGPLTSANLVAPEWTAVSVAALQAAKQTPRLRARSIRPPATGPPSI